MQFSLVSNPASMARLKWNEPFADAIHLRLPHSILELHKEFPQVGQVALHEAASRKVRRRV